MRPSSPSIPRPGELEILDYVVVEDGGVLVNPMIVDGQIFGGTAQGIGTALYEEMRFDAQGQPLASTLSDYLLPGPTEVPDIRIVHMETPSPYTRFGQKGIGEGGAIAPPAAITNAVNDALAGLGAELLVSPITPRRIVEAIDRAAHARRPPHEARRLRLCAPGIGGGGRADARRHARRQGAGRRPDAGARCSICAWPSRRCWSTSRASPSWPPSPRMPTAVTIGATVTHAAIEDGRVTGSDRRLSRPGRARHRLPRGAHARHHRRQPRACRPGGRLARRASTALGARGDHRGCRRHAAASRLASFVRGAMETELADDELLVGVRIPRFSRAARFGFHKICRKTGEFADAIGVAVHDPERAV